MKHISFTKPKEQQLNASFTGIIPSVKHTQELYAELEKALCFPEWWGKNWDALLDLYCDFSWIKEEYIVIFHQGLSNLSNLGVENYMELLLYSLDYWIHYPSEGTVGNASNCTSSESDFNFYQPHHLHFFFPKDEEQMIYPIIKRKINTCSFERGLKIEEI